MRQADESNDPPLLMAAVRLESKPNDHQNCAAGDIARQREERFDGERSQYPRRAVKKETTPASVFPTVF